MDRVPQRIEYRAVVFRDRRVQLPDVRRRNFHELRESAVLIDSNNSQILANVRSSEAALVTMPAIDVHLRADKIPRLHRGDFFSDSFDHAAKLVTQRYRGLDAPLRTAVPSINVQICSA